MSPLPGRRSAPPHLWLSASLHDRVPKTPPAASAPRYEQLCRPTGCGTTALTYADVSQSDRDGAVPGPERLKARNGVTRAGLSRSTTTSGSAGPGSAPLSRASPDSTTDLANSRASDSPSVPLPSSNSIPRGAAASTGPQPSPLVLSHDRSTAQKLAYGSGTPRQDRQSPDRRRTVQERTTPLLSHVVGMICATPILPSPPKSTPCISLSALNLPPPIQDGFYRLSVSPSRAARGGSSADAADDVTTLSFPLPPDVRARARLAALESVPELGSRTVSSSRSQHAPSLSAPSVPIPDFVPVPSHHHDRSRSEELAGLSTRRDDPAIFASARDPTVPSSWSRCSRRTELPLPTSMAASYSIQSSSRSRTHETPVAETTASTSQQAPSIETTTLSSSSSSSSNAPTRVRGRSVSWARNVAPGWSLRAEQLAWAEARRQSRRRPPLIGDSKEGGFARERGAFRTRIVGAVFVVIVLAVVILLVVGLAIALTR